MYCKTCGKEVNEQAAVCMNCGCPPLSGKSYCSHCGSQVNENMTICASCGMSLKVVMKSDKDRTTCALLCFFLGALGVHRFYVGKSGTGILWLLTGGCLGFGIIVDLIMIFCGSFKDINGAVV